MNWVKLTDFDNNKPVWVNLRTHDAMTWHEDEKWTRIAVYDGGHQKVVETPEQILGLLLAQAELWRRSM